MKAAPHLPLLQALTGSLRALPRDKADTLLLLFSCTLVLLPHFGHLPVWAVPACIALLLWRGWLTFRGKRMPARRLLLPIAALAMLGVFLTYKTLLGREAGVAMLALLLALKLLEMHAKRDLFVALFLSFFLILASFFYSQSIGTALLTLIALLAILTTQLSFQYTDTVPPLGRRLKLGATILALAAPLMLVLFLLFPRIEGPLWGLPSDAHANRTGLSDTMSPGNISDLAQSDDIAFRVKFRDEAPPQKALYWRGPTLGSYDGRTWTALPARRGVRQISTRLRGDPVHYQVTLEPHGRRWLFALDIPQELPRIDGGPAYVGEGLQLLFSKPVTQRLRYDAVSHTEYELQPNLPASALQPWLTLPAGYNPRTLEFARQLRSRHPQDKDLIEAALHFFRQQNFRYTLQPPPLGRDVVDEFLFSTRAGFCEHYSAAFVTLMRAAGVPARVVTGYQGGEVNPADGYMTVRQSDAHAWSEVWLPGRGWVRIDPTAAVAPNRIERNLGRLLPRPILGGLITLDVQRSSWLAGWHRIRLNWEALTNSWNQWVLSYTPDKQRKLVESLGFSRVDWRTLTALMMVLGSAVTAAAVLPLLWNRPRIDPIEALYRALCRALAKQGIPRAPYEGPRAYRMRLTAPDSPLPARKREAVARFLELYESARYGIGLAPAAVKPQLKTLLSECR
jgi:transglutaminase-like putative cysteine protease